MTSENTAVITGIGLITPLGEEKEVFWKNLLGGGSGIKEITAFDTSKYAQKKAGEISEFDPQPYLGKKGLRYLSRTSKLLMSAAYLCLKDAGIKNDDREYLCYDGQTVGAVIGTTFGSLASICSFDETSLTEGPQFVSPMAFPNTVMNCHAGYLAIKEGIQGPTITVATGYDAPIDSVGIAIQYLFSSGMKCFVVGGVEELSEPFFLSHAKLGPLSETSCIGEGCGIFAVERLSDANDRKARIYGEAAGYGNGFCETEDDLKQVVNIALEDAHMDSSQLDMVIKGTNLGERERTMQNQMIATMFSPKMSVINISDVLGDSYSAGASFQIGAALGFIEYGTAANVLTISLDPSGACSALIVRKHFSK